MGIEKVGGRSTQCSDAKKNRRRPKKVSSVQRLYNTCKEVFANCGPNVVPSPSDVERLKSVLDGITEADVGLKPNMPFFRKKESDEVPRITYLHLYGCDKFSIGIFCLPPSGVIPLHNHPGMTVFGKLLFGNMHIKSYDWVGDNPIKKTQNANPLDVDDGGLRLAKLKVDSEFAAPMTSILYPADGGNMHCFTAATPCAVLDVLGPPYSDPDGRHCTYYLDFPFSDFPGDAAAAVEAEEEEGFGYAWLKEREKPVDHTVVAALYSGPKIVEK